MQWLVFLSHSHGSLLKAFCQTRLRFDYTMYLLNLYVTSKIWLKVNFLVEDEWFEFRLFFLLDRLSYPC